MSQRDLIFLGAVAAIAGIWGVVWLLHRGVRISRPRKALSVFDELAACHGLSADERLWLNQFAEGVSREVPSRIFTQPELWAAGEGSSARGTQLFRRLFGEDMPSHVL